MSTVDRPTTAERKHADRNGADRNGVERRIDPAAIDLSSTLAALYATVKPELRRVDARLDAELHSDHPEADAVIRHGIRLAGKRLRPALLLLAGQAVGRLRDDHITLAAVVEMIHTATLVHDDVLDEAAIRRHVDTVNARWNNETSVLLGDFLFTHAFYLASTLESTFACRLIGRSTNIVCDGELRQTITSGDVNLSEDDYLAIVEAKTAELCACCCELGAHYADGDEETTARLASFGRNLGIAFQIADDLLDLEGNETSTGKSLGTDLAKCKMTLPLIHCRDNLDTAERKKFLTAVAGSMEQGARSEELGARSNENGARSADRLPAGAPGTRVGSRLPALHAWLARHDSLTYARHQAQLYADRAQAQLADLPDSPAKAALSALADFTVARRG